MAYAAESEIRQFLLNWHQKPRKPVIRTNQTENLFNITWTLNIFEISALSRSKIQLPLMSPVAWLCIPFKYELN